MKRLRQRACLVGLLVYGVVQGLPGGMALAATYPVGPLTFPIGPLDFPSGLTTSETAATIEVTLPADILFDFDKADLRPDAQVPLHETAQLLRDKARGPVMIQGYTDAVVNDTYNQRLSERRASAVKTWFATHEGLASMKFGISGFGPRNPVAPNRNPDGSDNPAGRQLNRRVTLIIPK